MSSEEKFRVDLGGIVELLSRNLYSGSDVYLRELLQNGVDAITANAQSGKDDEGTYSSDTSGRIRFVVDGHTLTQRLPRTIWHRSIVLLHGVGQHCCLLQNCPRQW